MESEKGMVMQMEEPFYYGVDISWDIAQVSRYNRRTGEPESVSFSGGQQEVLLPVALYYRQETDEWLAGQDAVRMATKSEGFFVNGLLHKLSCGEGVRVGERSIEPKELIAIYFRALFDLFRRCYGTSEFAYMVVTLPDKAAGVKKDITEAILRLGISEERFCFLSHSECFMYYCVNTPQNLWMNDTALFACDEESFYFERLSKAKKKHPIVLQSELTELSEGYLRYDVRSQTPERKAYWFYEQAQEQLKEQQISTIYVTGTGFMGGWADDVLRKLCDGRRVFFGQNLFTRGACQAARMLCNGSAADYLFLCGDMIRESIYLKLYHDSSEQYHELAHAGMDYHDVNYSARIILDDTNEIEFMVQSVRKSEPVYEMMILEHPLKKQNKTTRLELTLRYLDCHSPVVQIRDMSFAGTKSTRRIWEQRL